jgi:pyruvate dehydrogenase E2 component (dihydrolipoamide acetyltransferase)
VLSRLGTGSAEGTGAWGLGAMAEDASRAGGGRAPRRIEQSRMRQAVGRQMSLSKQTVPHFYVSTEIVMDEVLELSRRLSAQPEMPRISVTSILVRALSETLLERPAFNATLTTEGWVAGDAVNVGIAIALEGGLVAPALLGCQDLDLARTAAALDDLVARTRSGKLRAPEMGSATFTLSNLGMFDVSSFAAIVIPPQAAILATGRAIPRPVVLDGAVAVRSVMTATLSADHRVVDGAEAAQFLGEFRSRLLALAREQ